MVRAGDDVGDDFGLGRIRDGGLKDADDRRRTRAQDTVETDRLADNGGIAFEDSGPEMICEYHRAFGFGAVIAHVKQSAENGMQANNVKIFTVDDAGAQDARLAESEHSE